MNSTEPVAYAAHDGTLHHDRGQAHEGWMPLYTGAQVADIQQRAKRDGKAAGRREVLDEASYSWTCPHTLSGLKCTNPQPHKNNGLGCTHAASDAPDRHDKSEAADQ